MGSACDGTDIMSIESVAIALHHSRTRGTAKLVLLGIANHDGDGGAWPSVATLAKYAGVSARNVQKALRELEALGEIRTHRQEGGTGRTRDCERPNLYDFLVACPDTCDRSKNHRVLPPVASDTRGASDASGGPVTDATSKPSPQPSGEPSSGFDGRSDGLPAGPTAPRPAAKSKPRKPTKLQQDRMNADYRELVKICQEEDIEDPYSVWWTLRLEHKATSPSRFMADLLDKGQWDGFVGNHGITTYERSA